MRRHNKGDSNTYSTLFIKASSIQATLTCREVLHLCASGCPDFHKQTRSWFLFASRGTKMICEHTAIFKRPEERERKKRKSETKTSHVEKGARFKTHSLTKTAHLCPELLQSFISLLCQREQPQTLSVLVIKVKSALL